MWEDEHFQLIWFYCYDYDSQTETWNYKRCFQVNGLFSFPDLFKAQKHKDEHEMWYSIAHFQSSIFLESREQPLSEQNKRSMLSPLPVALQTV